MHFYRYCPVEHGYIRGGGILPPPLDQFPQFGLLPTEIQLKILEDAFGDTVRGLAWLEQVSKLWQEYVLRYLWPGFLKKKFTEAQIERAKIILGILKQAETWKNIYRVLSVKPIVLTRLEGSNSAIFTADRPFIIYMGNDGPGDAVLTLGKSDERGLRLNTQIGPGMYSIAEREFPPGMYTLSLRCQQQRCNAYAGIFYVNDPNFDQPSTIDIEF